MPLDFQQMIVKGPNGSGTEYTTGVTKVVLQDKQVAQ